MADDPGPEETIISQINFALDAAFREAGIELR